MSNIVGTIALLQGLSNGLYVPQTKEEEMNVRKELGDIKDLATRIRKMVIDLRRTREKKEREAGREKSGPGRPKKGSSPYSIDLKSVKPVIPEAPVLRRQLSVASSLLPLPTPPTSESESEVAEEEDEEFDEEDDEEIESDV